ATNGHNFQSCPDAVVCSVAYSNLQLGLRHSICSLALKGALGSTNSMAMDQHLIAHILRLHSSLGTQMPPCPFSRKAGRSSFLIPPLLQQASTPEEAMSSHDWRKRLATDLLRDATFRHESIIRS